MPRPESSLCHDAERIWRAGVAAVQPDRLLRQQVHREGDQLTIGDETISLDRVGRIAIVGAGKGAGAMALVLEEILGPRLLTEKRVTGWVNVPADCLQPTQCVRLHAGRPAGVNEPRPEGVAGTQEILRCVRSLGPNDLCLCVITGGGSALLPAPVPGISLDDKICLTRLMSSRGADIEQLNKVRRLLSQIKGGGLARACRAGKLITLIISDVLGDPLDVIASGPTVPSTTTAADALEVLSELKLMQAAGMGPIVQYLKSQQGVTSQNAEGSRAVNLVIGNNATAVDGAGIEAERLGYSHAMLSATTSEGPAEVLGHHLAEMALRMRADAGGPDCLITGGEPTVTLVDEDQRGLGGRNQQLALAALSKLGECKNIALLAAGTDGEDGPTDAAGAFVTQEIVQAAHREGLDPQDFLNRNDAYHFFAPVEGLLRTGPTLTNVCDLRVVTVRSAEGP